MTKAKETEFLSVKCETFCCYTKYRLSCRSVSNSAEFLTTIKSFTTDHTTLKQNFCYTIQKTPEELGSILSLKIRCMVFFRRHCIFLRAESL